MKKASIIIHIAVSQTPEDIDMQNSATHLLSYKDLIAVFCSNEGTTSSFLSVVSKGEDLADGGKYADLVVVGFDAGKTQKDALRQGLLYGSITQDPYHIGYYAVEMAIAAAKGETVNNIYTTALWYDSSNIDIDEISLSTYD
jgi:ribose transport system substrate-binding protein